MRKKEAYETVKKRALEQTAEYAKKCDATESHIIIFDRDEKTDWREKVFIDGGEFDGTVLRLRDHEQPA